MASITAHPTFRPTATARPAAKAPVEIVDDHQPHHEVPGPNERTLARTTAVVIISLAVLVGAVVGVAWGLGQLVDLGLRLVG